MLSAVTIITFWSTALVVMALFYAFAPAEASIRSRLEELTNSANRRPKGRFSELQQERARNLLAKIGKLLPAAAETRANRAQVMMLRAGYRSADAFLAIRGMKVILPAALAVFVLLSGIYQYNPAIIFLLAIVLGFMLPEIWLLWRIQVRQRLLRLALPDALDLLVICVEVGLGLDQSLIRVSQELKIVHPELSDELQMVNFEMRVGKTRLEALRELARRTGLEDLKALVAMLIQTERFGTSIGQSLRIYSDELRTRRRQSAEEMSAKTTVKMVPALVAFIFPALLVVILGPALISLMRQLLPALK
jgi:tight adherence protein C